MSVCGPRRGTYAGAQAHRKAREPACAECRRAAAAYMQERRWAANPKNHTHALPAWLVRQLLAAVPVGLQQTANDVIGCWLCAPRKDSGGCEGHPEGDAGEGESSGGSAL
jgi:hypothetical protein